MQIDSSKIKKILIIQLRALGDVVLTTAVLPGLRRSFPGAEIDFLTGTGFDGLLRGLPEIDKVLVYPYTPQNISGMLKFFPGIRKRNFDLVIDFQGTPGTALLSYLSGADYRLGWENTPRRFAYNLTSNANLVDEYVPYQKCKMLEQLRIPEVNGQTAISFNETELQIAKDFLHRNFRSAPSLRVNMSVKGKRQARQWYPEKFARLADLLVEKHKAQLFFNQGPGEQDYVSQVAQMCRHKPVVLPVWPLPVFAAFLSLVDLHFSYDNGAKHIAVAAGTPTLSLFATDKPVYWNPPESRNHPFLISEVPCKFCGLRECDLMICMKKVEPEDILAAIEKIPAISTKLFF